MTSIGDANSLLRGAGLFALAGAAPLGAALATGADFGPLGIAAGAAAIAVVAGAGAFVMKRATRPPAETVTRMHDVLGAEAPDGADENFEDLLRAASAKIDEARAAAAVFSGAFDAAPAPQALITAAGQVAARNEAFAALCAGSAGPLAGLDLALGDDGTATDAAEILSRFDLTATCLEEKTGAVSALADGHRLSLAPLEAARGGDITHLLTVAPASGDDAAPGAKTSGEDALLKALDQLEAAIRGVVAGNLRVELGDDLHPRAAPLAAALDEVRNLFEVAMSHVAERSGGINRGAQEIHRAADDLSRRTESQAAALEETVTALKQLTEGVEASAADADQAAQFTSTASKNATSSEDVMAKSLEAMRKIESSSNQISQIIGVIDDIAFQTNLLALNAGVEAARAGDAGRGFAVVASEVRALAQRCSDAAREIKDLISASSAQVKEGVQLANGANDALGEILRTVTRINELVSGISFASKEQAVGVKEILSAMAQLDEVTQSNAAMVEEMTAASRDLNDDSNSLITTVDDLKRGNDISHVASPAAKASARKLSATRDAAAPAAGNDAAQDAEADDQPPIRIQSQTLAIAGSTALAAAAEEDGWEEF